MTPTPTPTPETVLEPCPFCGSGDVQLSDWLDTAKMDGTPIRLIYVECVSCESNGPHVLSPPRAIARWNTRTVPSAPEANDE